MEQTNPKHLRYRVESIRDRFMIVKRVADSETFTCPTFDNVKIDTSIILYEKGINSTNGKPQFAISSLNYQPGSVYSFDIKERKDNVYIISGRFGETHAVPLFFINDTEDKIDLQIKSIDKATNQLIFEQPSRTQADYSAFIPGNIYELNYIGRSTNNERVILLSNEDNQFEVYLSGNLFKINFPEKIQCHFKSELKGLQLHYPFLKKFIYKDKIGTKQYFTITEIMNNSDTGIQTWKVRDQYDIPHFYNPELDRSFDSNSTISVGDEIELTILNFTSSDNLKLIHSFAPKNTKNFLVEDIFDAIGYSDEDTKYFFELAQQIAIAESLNTNYLDQYNDGNNLWIFSYFYALDLWILNLLEEGDFEECKKVISIYQAFEQWIIEDSTFLEAFSEHKAQESIRKGESKLESLGNLHEAILLIENGKDDELIEDVLNKLQEGKHVLSKRKNIFKELVRISQFINIDEDQDDFYNYVVVLIKNNLLEESDIVQFKRSIYKKLSLERDTIESLLQTTSPEALSESKKILSSFLKYQYLLCILSNRLGDDAFTKAHSVNFLKILSKIKNNNAFVELAIKLLATNGFLNFSASHIIDPNNLLLVDLEQIIHLNPINAYASKKGFVKFENKMFTISPSFLMDKNAHNHPFKYEVVNLPDLSISIRTSKDIIPLDLNDKPLDLLDTINHILKNQTNVFFTEEDTKEKMPFASADPNLKIVENPTLLKDLFMISKCLDLLIIQETDKNKEIIYSFIQFCIMRTLGNNRAYAFRDKLDNYRNKLTIEYLATEEPDTLIKKIKSNDLSLDNLDNVALNLFKYFDTDQLDIPVDITVEHKLLPLKKLIESFNVLSTYLKHSTDLDELKSVIIQELLKIISDAGTDNVLIKEILTDTIKVENDHDLLDIDSREPFSLGHETKNIEFKSSLFHSASDTPQEFVILKTICGFLNAYEGGVLYIGVNDKGDIIGLKNDLNVKPEIKTIDNLQNHLQRLIADAFPKEINALLDYRQRKSGELDYLEIHIPTYDKVVVLQNKYYQRQGTQTRLLQGLDIQDLIIRKLTKHKNVPVFINALKENNHLNTTVGEFTPIEIDARERVDFYIDQKEEGEYDESNSLEYQEANSYLHILENNSYIVTRSKSISDSKYSIALTKEFKNGYLLYCYDNACVNKVEVRTLLSKELNFNYKNGLSKEGKLVKLILAKNEDSILVSVKRNNVQYAKIYAVNKITTHRIVHLKGNCIVQEDYDRLEMFHLFEKVVPELFRPFVRSSRQGYGNKISANKLPHFTSKK